MWVLSNVKEPEKKYYLLVGVEYTVGRKDTDILVLNDQSISRKHACLQVSHSQANISNPECLPILKVIDAGSKYGTYVNSNKKVGQEGMVLTEKDTVTFGQLGSCFLVEHYPQVVTTSCLDEKAKIELAPSLLKLGAHLVSEWRTECTHLVMASIKITIKAVCAMVSLKPLVSVEYFTTLVKNIEEKKGLLDVERFNPPLGEATIDCSAAIFSVEPQRKTLFASHTFVFLCPKQYKKLHLAVTLGGAKTLLVEADEPINFDLLTQQGTCVIQFSSDNHVSSLAKVASTLKRHNLRMIPESDVGLAVVYCSTDKHCNPQFNGDSSQAAKHQLLSQTLTQQEFYAAETQFETQGSQEQSVAEGNFSHGQPFQKMDLRQTVPSTISEEVKSREVTSKMQSEASQQQSISEDSYIQGRNHSKMESCQVVASASQQEKMEVTTSKKRIRSDPEENPFAVNKVIKSERLSGVFEARAQTRANGSKSLAVKEEPQSPIASHVDSRLEDRELPCGTRHRPHSDSPHSLVNGSLELHSIALDEDTDHVSTMPKNSMKSESRVSPPEDNKENDSRYEANLPSNLLTVEFKDMMTHQNHSLPARSVSSTPGVKSFKKFQKQITCSDHTRLPEIIGGRDLEIYVRASTQGMDDWLNEHPESQTGDTQEDDMLFNWDSGPSNTNRGRKRKR